MDHYGQLEAFKEFVLFCRQQGLPRAKMGEFEAVFPLEHAEREPVEKMTKEQIAAAEAEIQYGATGIVPVNLRDFHAPGRS